VPDGPLPRVITIDGQAHTGKSLAATRLAARLGLHLLNTGAMYRGVAHLLRERGIDVLDMGRDADGVHALISEWEFALEGHDVAVNGEPLPPTIFDEPMNALASAVSKWAEVRRKLQAEQKRIAGLHPHVVCEGRDQGTKVFPEAELKFFFCASYEVQADRAARKQREIAPTRPVDMTALRDRVEARDREDKSRAVDPLRKADEAVEIDTSALTPDQVLDRLLEELAAWQSRSPAT
jgi:cytidylate kinase